MEDYDDYQYYAQFKDENMEKNKSSICDEYIDTLTEFNRENETEEQFIAKLEQTGAASLKQFIYDNDGLWKQLKEYYKEYSEDKEAYDSYTGCYYKLDDCEEKVADIFWDAMENKIRENNSANMNLK